MVDVNVSDEYGVNSINLVTFLLALLFFHLSEVLLVLIYERHRFSSRSILFSRAYLAAMAFAIGEYILELHILLPSFKRHVLLQYGFWPGLVGVLLGEGIRKSAWITANYSFSHDIQTKKHDSHRLITHGIYRWFRHPAYFGWFLWAISTQVLLANPASIFAFIFVIWHFFSERIPYEEAYLLHFFGRAYRQYRNVTPTRIPGIP